MQCRYCSNTHVPSSRCHPTNNKLPQQHPASMLMVTTTSDQATTTMATPIPIRAQHHPTMMEIATIAVNKYHHLQPQPHSLCVLMPMCPTSEYFFSFPYTPCSVMTCQMVFFCWPWPWSPLSAFPQGEAKGYPHLALRRIPEWRVAGQSLTARSSLGFDLISSCPRQSSPLTCCLILVFYTKHCIDAHFPSIQ